MTTTNTGNFNSGYGNTGKFNTGYYNAGNYNSGNYNAGNYNAGNYNAGNFNAGYYNSGDGNTGFFNVDEPSVRMFGKDTGKKRGDINLPDFFYFSLTEWVTSEKMCDDEKKLHPSHGTTGGYLKSYGYKEAWRNAWDKAEESERKKTLNLPNFDAGIFLEITGIDVNKELGGKVKITVEGRDIEISRESAVALGLVQCQGLEEDMSNHTAAPWTNDLTPMVTAGSDRVKIGGYPVGADCRILAEGNFQFAKHRVNAHDALVEALERHGIHYKGCPVGHGRGRGGECDCGLDAALKLATAGEGDTAGGYEVSQRLYGQKRWTLKDELVSLIKHAMHRKG